MANFILQIFFYLKAGYSRKILISCIIALAVMGCDTTKDINPWANYPVPSCPKIQLLKGTDVITSYRSGAGRDITDIRYEAEINGFKGNCEYLGKKGVYSEVKLIVKVDFKITRGSAAQGRSLKFPYFIAIPEFYPKPSGQQTFIVKVKFPENRNTLRIVDKEVEILIPLKGSRKGPNMEIYIGFKLTPEQLKFNRRNIRAPRIN
jgi:hypothetical protein